MPTIEELISNMSELSETVNKGLKEVDNKIKESVDKKEYKRYKTFLKRYSKLMQKGEVEKAQQLAKDYKNGN